MEWVVMMGSREGGSLVEHFGNLEDPRRDQGKRHQLLDIIAMTVCAVVGGAEGWSDVELFVKCKYEWFQGFLDLPNGVPCSDTFARVFTRIHPERFQDCFMDWVSSISRLTHGQVMAVDGKTLRRTHDRNSGIGGYSHGQRLGYGELLGAGSDQSGREIRLEIQRNHCHTRTPELVGPVEGCIVTIDAMGCQKKIAQQIISQDADYVLAVKENQGRLLEDVADLFSCGQRTGFEDMQHDFCQTLDKGHGRIETRGCWTIDSPEQLSYLDTGGEWLGLRGIGMVAAERRAGKSGVSGIPVLYFQSGVGRQGAAPSNPKPLGHREPCPLGAGPVLPGGRKPGQDGKRCAKPGGNPAHGPQPPAKRPRLQNLHQSQAQTGRLGQ